MVLIRYLFLGLFTLSAVMATYFAEEIFFPEKSSFTREGIENSIDSDLIQMKKDFSKTFFRNLKKIYISDHRIEKRPIDWKGIFSNHFTEMPDSQRILQIDLFDSDEGLLDEESLLIIQYSLVDEKTKNKIWELSRTYKVPK